ncbi:MAG: glycosyltransferase [Bacteroidota bacterium]
MEINISSESLVWLCQIVFVVATLIQFVFLLFVQGRLAFFKGESKSSNSPGVSVVIAARNEEGNLLQNLPSVLEQDYPEFEVIVINDSSVDDSITVLRAFEINYPQLRVINILENDNYEGGKKYAITLGVKGAKYERLIFTDADCRPVSRKWIQKVVASRTAEGNIVLGYSPYQKTSGFLNRIVRFETFSNGLNYLSFALSGMPYMGVGRNLSYDRSSFFKVGGFKSHYRLLSGDDDLFVNEVANKSNTDICLEEESIVESILQANVCVGCKKEGT